MRKKKLLEKSHINQFSMNLQPKFESIRVALMDQEISLDLDTCVQEVLCEEI